MNVGIFVLDLVIPGENISSKLPIGTIGLGYMSVVIDDIPFTYEEFFGNEELYAGYEDRDTEYHILRYFQYRNILAKVAYQISQNDHLHFGISTVYYQTDIDDIVGRGFNFDLGFK